MVKYNIGLKTLLHQAISELVFYGSLVYKFKRIVGKPYFSDQFKRIIKRYKIVGYNMDIMRQPECLVVKVRKEAKIRNRHNRYNQVPHLALDATWESDKNKTKPYKRAKRSALSQQGQS